MRMLMGVCSALVLCVVSILGQVVVLNVPFEQILRSDREPQNWLTYSENVLGQRYRHLSARERWFCTS
jgi:hypothetical protein